MTFRLALTAIGSILLCVTTDCADAAVYKCAVDKNRVVYQDTPCAPGNELRNLDKDPPTLSVVPGTPTPTSRSSTPSSTSSSRSTRSAPSDRRVAKDQGNVDKAGERRFIRVGMTEAEVLSRIGRPEVNAHKRDKHDKRGSSATQWSYLPNAGDPETTTTVTIVGGKVTDVERKISR